MVDKVILSLINTRQSSLTKTCKVRVLDIYVADIISWLKKKSNNFIDLWTGPDINSEKGQLI